MLRAARFLATSGSHGRPQLLLRRHTVVPLQSPSPSLLQPKALLHSSASATQAVRDDEGGEGGEGAGSGSAGGRRSLRQRIKEVRRRMHMPIELILVFTFHSMNRTHTRLPDLQMPSDTSRPEAIPAPGALGFRGGQQTAAAHGPAAAEAAGERGHGPGELQLQIWWMHARDVVG